MNRNNIFSYDYKLIAISSFLAVLLSFSSPYILLPVTIILILYLIYFFKEKLLLSLIVISYLAITSEFYELYRIYVTIIASISLIILFLKKFGLQLDRYTKVPKEILYFLILLFFSLIISSIFSSYPLTGFLAITRIFFFLIICYLFYSLLENEQYVYLYIYSIFVVVLILGIRMLIDFFNLGVQNYFARVLVKDMFNLQGSLGYTGLTIFFISISLIVALFFIDKFKKPSKIFILWVLLICNGIILILANSRGGIMAAGLSSFFILSVVKRSLFFKTFLFSSFSIIILIIIVPALSDIVNLYLRWETVGARQKYWQMGLDLIYRNPVLGIGADTFDKYFYTYASSSTLDYFNAIEIGKPHPHNFFLFFTAENGIPGLITSISFFVLFFYFGFRTMRITKKNNDYFILSTAITGIGIGLFFRSFIEITGYLTYGYIKTDLPFWLMFGILISIYQKFVIK